MLSTIYHFNLGNPILKSKVAIGSVNKSDVFAYVTLGGKINLYFPPKTLESKKSNSLQNEQNIENHFLNLNKDITCLEFCPTDSEKTKKSNPNDSSDVLFIGSETTLMCYDILNNKTLFDKEIMEGVFCMVCGKYSSFTEPLCIAGGNCNLIGVDINGEDKFWTVLGGNTICMSIADLDKDGQNELLVGTDDFTIRFYKNEDSINEINENNKIVILAHIQDEFFLYGLDTGTIGLYKGNQRSWKIKENGYCTTMEVSDFNEDEKFEALCGLSTGKIIMIDIESGKELFNLSINNDPNNSFEISKFFYGDFTLSQNQYYKLDESEKDSRDQIICFVTNGDVYGYFYSDKEYIVTKDQRQFIAKDKKVLDEDIDRLESLLKEKDQIIDELEALAIKDSNKSKINAPKDELSIPKDTKVNIDLESNDDDKCADLIIESSEGTLVKMVVISSEQIFKGQTFVKYPPSETNKVIVQIKNKKDLNINLHIKVLVGTSYFLDEFQVFEYNKIIPKYCFYILLREDKEYEDAINQGISFDFNERIDRLIVFLENSFNLPKSDLAVFKKDEGNFKIRFRSLRTNKKLEISVHNKKMKILTDEMELSGNLLQDYAIFINETKMKTEVNYLEFAKSYLPVFERIENLDRERNHFNINMTEIITNIKDLYVKAEDNRLIENIQSFKDYFRKIYLKNEELLEEFEKRSEKYNQLITDLKTVNELIQIASNLKVGNEKVELVHKCRNCIKKKDYKFLEKNIATGGDFA